MDYKRRRKIFGLIFWIWLAGIIVLSVLPNTPSISKDMQNPLISFGYLQHFSCYLIWTVLFFLWKMDEKYNIRGYKILLFLAGAVLLAVGGEWIQEIIIGRSFNLNDLWSNLIGIFSGIILFYFIIIKMILSRKVS